MPFATIGASQRGMTSVPLDIADAAALTSRLGLESVLVPSVFDISTSLDDGELERAADAASAAGVSLTVGVPYLHPFRVGQDEDLLRAGQGDAAAGLSRTLSAVAALGTTDIPFMLGYVEDRLSTTVPWSEQLEATARLFGRLAPQLRDLGVRLCIKTHEEITSFEILRLVEAVGSDVLTVGFDPVNVMLRLEDPVLAAQRLAGHVAHVFVDDCTFSRDGNQFQRWLCPVGEGLIDWDELTRILTAEDAVPQAWIDLHKGQYGIQPYDQDWLDYQPDLTVAEFARVMARVQTSATGVDSARLSELQQNQTRRETRLQPAVDRIKTLGGRR